MHGMKFWNRLSVGMMVAVCIVGVLLLAVGIPLLRYPVARAWAFPALIAYIGLVMATDFVRLTANQIRKDAMQADRWHSGPNPGIWNYHRSSALAPDDRLSGPTGEGRDGDWGE